jgi:hypothetical protein
VPGSVIFTIILRSTWINDGVCIDIVIGLLIGTKLLLSTEAYKLFGAGVDCMVFAMLFVLLS